VWVGRGQDSSIIPTRQRYEQFPPPPPDSNNLYLQGPTPHPTKKLFSTNPELTSTSATLASGFVLVRSMPSVAGIGFSGRLFFFSSLRFCGAALKTFRPENEPFFSRRAVSSASVRNYDSGPFPVYSPSSPIRLLPPSSGQCASIDGLEFHILPKQPLFVVYR